MEELTRSAARGCIDMPDTLRDALNVRVQTLSDEAQDRLSSWRRSPATGSTTSCLEAVSDRTPAELDAGLREAIDAAVLTADETGYGFRHALLREVVHDDLLPGQHARLHARFAALLEEHPELVGPGTAPLEIAHHWSAAHEVTKAFTWSITAAAVGSAAYHEALKMYERALELWDQVDDPVAVAGSARRRCSSRRPTRPATPARTSGRWPWSTPPWPRPGRTTRAERISRSDAQGQPAVRADASRARSSRCARRWPCCPTDADPVLRARVLEAAGPRSADGRRDADGVARPGGRDGGRRPGSARPPSRTRATPSGHRLDAIGEEAEAWPSGERAGELARGNARPSCATSSTTPTRCTYAGRYADAVSQALAGIELARERGLERSIGSMLAGNAAEPLLALGQWSRAER